MCLSKKKKKNWKNIRKISQRYCKGIAKISEKRFRKDIRKLILKTCEKYYLQIYTLRQYRTGWTVVFSRRVMKLNFATVLLNIATLQY